MSKNWQTKQKILKMLSEKPQTLTDISESLGLAPSTVSQHLKELFALGAIRESETQFSRKWRYYEVNEEFYNKTQGTGAGVSMSRAVATFGLALIAVFAAYFLLSGTWSGVAYLQAAPLGKGSTLLSVSDAPALYNISGAYVKVDTVSLRSATTGKVYVVSVNKTFNLTALRNVSEAMVSLNLSPGEYDQLTLSISGITVDVNGRNVTAIVPSKRIALESNVSIGNSTNWINFDFNLAKSLHLNGSGEVAFTPVVGMKRRAGGAVSLSSEDRVVVRDEGALQQNESYGMDLSGRMRRGFAIAQNVSLGIAGEHMLVVAGGVPPPILIEGRNRLIIIGNGTETVNETAVGMPMVGLPVTVNVSGGLGCVAERDAVYCNSNSSLNATEVGEEIMKIRAGLGRGGIGSPGRVSSSIHSPENSSVQNSSVAPPTIPGGSVTISANGVEGLT